MPVLDDLKAAVELLREQGVKEPLFVAPVGNIRCFVPCHPGHCICHASIDNRFCVVNAHGKTKALEHANMELEYLNKRLKEIENAHPVE